MSHSLPIRKSLRFFTMVELLAVMAVAGILLAITMTIASVDSTKANSQVVAGAISYASSYAMGNTSATDYDDNGYDQAVQVVIKSDTIIIKSYNEDNASKVLKTHNLGKGSHISKIELLNNDNSVSSTESIPYDFYFTSIGEPIEDPTTENTINKKIAITIGQKSSSDNEITIYVRPFTGKVTFYE